jgi:hypothetical protein
MSMSYLLSKEQERIQNNSVIEMLQVDKKI